MIKNLKRSDITVRPFNTFKSWTFGNINPADVILTEDGCPIFTSYLTSSSPLLCADPDFSASSISPEQQQVQQDFKIIDGVKIEGHFFESGSKEYVVADNPLNHDGSYKRLVYNSVKSSFYNDFENPEFLFGVETIDFDDRGRKKEIRTIQNKIRLGQISTRNYGHKIQPNTVVIKDQSNPDETYFIEDDGNTNLVLTDVFFKDETKLSADTSEPQFSPTGSYTPYNDTYGHSLSAFGDYIAVGNPDDIRTITGSGTGFGGLAHIIKFDTTQSIFRPIKTLFARPSSSTYVGPADGFGTSVSISDKWFAIGAPEFECYSGSQAGVVFVYDKYKGGVDNWGVINIFESTGSNDKFGTAVKILGDFLFIGVPGYEDNTGAVFFYRQKNYLSTDPCLFITTGSTFQQIVPDLSFFTPDTASNCVAAVLAGESGSFVINEQPVPSYISGSNTFVLEAILQPAISTAGEFFGGAIDAFENTLVIGNSKPTGSGAGKVHVFNYVSGITIISGSECDGGTWVESCQMNKSFGLTTSPAVEPFISENLSDSYGHSVAVDNAYLIVGSPTFADVQSPDETVNIGGVYVYTNDPDAVVDDCFCSITPSASVVFSECSWSFNNRFTLDDDQFRNNWFGHSVDIAENRFVVGCPIDKKSIIATYNGTEYTVEEYEEERSSGKFFIYKLNDEVVWELEKEFTKVSLIESAKQNFGTAVQLTEQFVYAGAPVNLYSDPSSSATYPTEYHDLTNLQTLMPENVSGSVYVYGINDLNNKFQIGNIFYKNGLVVITDTGSFFGNILSGSGTRGNEINFKGEHAIFENEFLIPIKPGQFNVSQNPTALVNDPVALDVNGNGIYDDQDMDLILRYLNKFKFLGESETVSDMSFINEQDEDWWNNSIIMTEAENVLLLITPSSSIDLLQEQFIADGNQLTTEILTQLETMDAAGLFDFDGDGKSNSFDGNILLNYTANIRNQALIAGNINDNSIRNTPSLVADHLDILTGKFNLINTLPEFHNYLESSSLDRTGSYLSPVVTTIGLYNEEYELVATAKLGKPAKILQDSPQNFIVRIDT